MSEETVVKTTITGEVAWVEINNPPVNATSTAVRQGLVKAVEAVKGARVAVLICAGRTFVAGGDMSEFDAPPAEPHLPDVVQMIEDSDVPFVAAMHGNVLGGGFEIAMGCAWRVATKDTNFGLPEVNVGLIPGAGGTQRLPRLIGMDAAIDIACSGKVINAAGMQALGGIDLVVEDLNEAIAAFVEDLPERPSLVRQRTVPAFADDLIEVKRVEIAKRAKGQQSPLENLTALQWALEAFDAGQPKERARHLELRQSAESRALRHAFFAQRVVARPDAIKGATAREIDHIAVVGGGLMGAGIATSALNAGLKVTLIERDAEAADMAQTRVHGLLQGAVTRGKMTAEAYDARKSAFRAVWDYGEAATIPLAIEAVFEDVKVKHDVFRQLAAVMAPDAILATNTSYLDPMDIFEGIENQSRCLGLHFFSPAHIMKLLEIVKTPHTAADVLATGFALGKRMRKVSVLSGICDGFIGNRMLAAYRRAADYLLADGALPFQVDRAMRNMGLPMGPYEMQDLTGLQIAWANRQRQAASRDVAERYVTIADQLCEMDRLGQRSGQGWYKYQEGHRAPIRDPKVEDLIVAYSVEHGITRRAFSDLEISDRLLAVLANEGARIVSEGIAERAADVDIVQIHGYGFPSWRGGPMQFASESGWENTVGLMESLRDESPGSWTISQGNARFRK